AGSERGENETSKWGENGRSGRLGPSVRRTLRLAPVHAAAHWTEDEQLLNRALPAEPVPQAAELGAFTHTDSWRVLRIQGEFVYGINALAEIGAAVTVFGSARFGESHPLYEASRRLGKLMAEAGFAVITGLGYMEAIVRGTDGCRSSRRPRHGTRSSQGRRPVSDELPIRSICPPISSRGTVHDERIPVRPVARSRV